MPTGDLRLRPSPRARARTVAVLSCALAAPLAAQPAAVGDIVDVIGTTPLGARNAARSAANVQRATAEELRASGALDLADFMRRSLSSLFVNDAQGNPLQPDVQYRGFVGSPLLGLPQGLAVYQDGVRLNEPFGDTVNWALIPEAAIDTVYVLPGSNPLFGLNALGGAIAVNTKSGFTSPGTRIEASAGSFGRTELETESGGSRGERLAYFVTATRLSEDGWRDYSPTDATQMFASLSAKTDAVDLDVGLSYAGTELVGNGAAPVDLLALDRSAIFTRPDRTRNRYTLLNVVGTRALDAGPTLTGNVFVRRSDIRTLNGDDSDFDECSATPGFLCEADGAGEQIALDTSGAAIAADPRLQGATLNRTSTDQRSGGFDLQATFSRGRGRLAQRLIAGMAYERSAVQFGASTELGALDATRLAVPGGTFVGDSLIDLGVRTTGASAYVTDTLSLGARADLTFSGRYNRARIELSDRLGGALGGDHAFARFNPAIGFTLGLAGGRTLYASASESSRAPSPVELTCADPDAPCRLPNAFVSDPPLEQVVARTLEAGVRGQAPFGRWHAGVFQTLNEHDILFISAGALTSQGFFANVGATRRAGIELELHGDAAERLTWFASYSYIDATFRESFAVPSPNNPAAAGGEITVGSGAHLPLVPSGLFKAGLSAAAGSHWRLGANLLASAGEYLRGDEANALGRIGGYRVLNLLAEHRLGARGTLFMHLDNALDERYETFGVLGDATGVLGPGFADPRFLGPGAPRSALVGIRFELTPAAR